ncbi:undecaprenyl-diphosphatase [Reticulibacter mediterranei]|uniref:Undecaprenyl-diphosphatase n=1 Tax=Reticulibacter mediterranei TaxID=2778369 RepID=A0A8J3IP80_9CHLR|nr:undecaprenyl-diphosphate phosphatase [Reticulibacter mediterranei]GHO99359.1 undecaprenyl-diphosphatase [Reticulibacter mediterranei]
MSLTWIQTLVLALLQGVTELFPISSLGHTVVIPGLLGWTELVQSPQFLPIVVAFHLGTSIALVVYFWRDWWRVLLMLGSSVRQGKVRQGDASWVGWLVIIGCIPGGILGVLLKKPVEHLFSSPLIAAVFLIVNGSLLLLGEALRNQSFTLMRSRKASISEPSFSQPGLPPAKHAASGLNALRALSDLSWKEALIIGLGQSLALIPGISRSGATMVAALGVGLSHEDAAHYTFLLGTPLIAGAALLELPELAGASSATLVLVIVGMVLSGVAAYLSTRFLMRYFETGRLHPFAYYCWGIGGISLILFLLGVGAR